MTDWNAYRTRDSAPADAVARAWRRRGWAITAVLVAVALVIVSFGVPVLAALGTLACGGGVILAWRILRAGMLAERRALQSEERVRDFAELATDWFCEIDGKFGVTYVSSREVERRAGGGASLESLLGSNWLLPGEPEGFEEITSGHSDAMRLRRPFRDHRFRQDTAGAAPKYWSLSGKPLVGADGRFAGYRTIATDVTGFVEACDAAQKANRAKSAFLANMSHELRTPLNAILGFSELVEMQIGMGIGHPRHGAYAHDIHVSGQHLLGIINDLLEHSRIEAGELVLRSDPFDVAEAVESVRMLSRDRADGLKVELKVEVAANVPVLLGDALRFKQVLINIVTNAIKFSPGGTVTLTATLQPDERLRVAVADSGIGMDAAGIAQALRPFGQVDSGLNRKYEGTGLGVPLSKSLTELQGGTFHIASQPGAGTCVTILLPVPRAPRDIVSVAAR